MILEIRTRNKNHWRLSLPAELVFTLYNRWDLAGSYLWVPRTPGRGLYSWSLPVWV